MGWPVRVASMPFWRLDSATDGGLNSEIGRPTIASAAMPRRVAAI
jgi:hypothetical protein